MRFISQGCQTEMQWLKSFYVAAPRALKVVAFRKAAKSRACGS